MHSGEGILFERMSIGHPGRRLGLPSARPIGWAGWRWLAEDGWPPSSPAFGAVFYRFEILLPLGFSLCGIIPDDLPDIRLHDIEACLRPALSVHLTQTSNLVIWKINGMSDLGNPGLTRRKVHDFPKEIRPRDIEASLRHALSVHFTQPGNPVRMNWSSKPEGCCCKEKGWKWTHGLLHWLRGDYIIFPLFCQ